MRSTWPLLSTVIFVSLIGTSPEGRVVKSFYGKDLTPPERAAYFHASPS
jgi:hypothetical protein